MTSAKKIAFIFPGQGAQYVGMAKDFFDQYNEAKELFQHADEILRRSLSKIVFEGPESELTETKNSQVAIYVVSMAILKVIHQQFPSIKPSVCAGLSLGEYSALTASKRINFETCLPLVQRRGEYMNQACEVHAGTMAVVLGLEADVVEDVVRKIELPNDLWTANFNCPGQVVISGTQKGIEAGTAALKEKGAKRILPLQVHGAFHSGLMKFAEERLAEHIHPLNLLESDIAFAMNVPGDFVQDSKEIKSNLVHQVTHSVRWEQSIRKMGEAGVDLFIEIGCGKTLSGFNKRILPHVSTISIEKVSELDQLAKIIG